MDLVLAASRPWHYWLAAAIIIGAVLLVIATIVGYLVKVSAARYPRD